ncbi:hypothetical protein EV360DRAFT_87436 [Lentinula raphanica]|nr:hypothetical protein EV360DRAFT_87436 [Lentinula raphanica]
MNVDQTPSQRETDSNGILVAPAPWPLKARMWNFVVSPLKVNRVNGKSSAVFPAGWAASFQADAMAEGEIVAGHPGFIMLVQYTDTPVGPYDELMYIAGKFSKGKGTSESSDNDKQTPDAKGDVETGFRITRIFVSTKESVANGRRNWNIGKELAKFNYTRNPDGSWDLAVYPLEQADPFFHISVRPIPVLGSIPIPMDFKILGSYFRLLHPPLPSGPTGSASAVVQSNTNPDGSLKEPKWAALIPAIKGKMKLVTYESKVDLSAEAGGEDSEQGGRKKAIADGVNFPAVVPWKLGAYLEDVDIDFYASDWV